MRQPLGLSSAVNVDCYSANSIGCPSESVSSSKWHVWFGSHCPGMCLSTWQMIAASCPTALGALCGSADIPTCIVLRTLSSYGDRTSAAAGPRLWNFLSSCTIQTSPAACSDNGWRDTFFREAWTTEHGISVELVDYLLWHLGENIPFDVF